MDNMKLPLTNFLSQAIENQDKEILNHRLKANKCLFIKSINFSYLLLFLTIFSFQTYSQVPKTENQDHFNKIAEYEDEISKLVDSIGFYQLKENLSDQVIFAGGEYTEAVYYKQLALLKVMLSKEENNFILSKHLLDVSFENYLKENKNKDEIRKKIGQLSTSDDYFLFSRLVKSPTAKKCKKVVNNLKRKACLQEEVKQFIIQNFDTHAAVEKLKKSGKINEDTEDKKNVIIRSYVSFKINHSGKVEEVEAFSEHDELIEMCEELIRKLPDFIPCELDDFQKVRVSYSVPIVFQMI